MRVSSASDKPSIAVPAGAMAVAPRETISDLLVKTKMNSKLVVFLVAFFLMLLLLR